MKDMSDGWAGTMCDKPRPGWWSARTRTTSMVDVERFAAMTGDRNPLHFDKALAEASVLGGLVVQGGVTTGLLNAVVAEELPGPGSVFLETNWQFRKAVAIGETLTATVTVTDVRDDKPICRLETQVGRFRGLCLRRRDGGDLYDPA